MVMTPAAVIITLEYLEHIFNYGEFAMWIIMLTTTVRQREMTKI